jgi:hypothetical protein
VIRPFILGAIGLSGLGFSLLSIFAAVGAHRVRQAPVECDSFIARPAEAWVTLVGCRLDFDDAVLMDGTNVERLSDRKVGIAHSVQPRGFEWTTMVVPVKAPNALIRPSRVVTPITDVDVLAWVNAIERATTVEERERLSSQTKLIDRLASPTRITGHGERGPLADAVQRVLGREGMAGLVVLRPAEIPGVEVPDLGILTGVLGLIAIAIAIAGLGRARALGSSIEADLTNADVSGVKLEIGELEALRREQERERRQRRKQ